MNEQNRVCPICESNKYILFLEQHIEENLLSEFSYASRKEPEFMRFKLVRCKVCDAVYAPSPPTEQFLEQAYTEAAYDSDEEAQCAAASYIKAMHPFLTDIDKTGTAIDVGAGNGALLPYLLDSGFEHVLGIEPSRAAIEAAKPDVLPYLMEGMFTAKTVHGQNNSLICSFMTLEHLREPGIFINDVYNLLSVGGKVILVVHNWRALLNRLLGRRSPIIDIEHLQLYSPASIKYLLGLHGFQNISIFNISNSYSLQYWCRLLPLPASIKGGLLRLLCLLKLQHIKIPLRVGNLMAVAEKK